jgi:hypothetical protein
MAASPHEKGSAAARLPDPSGQHRTIANRSHGCANDTGQMRFWTAGFLYFRGAAPVHDIGSGIYHLVRASREYQGPSAPQSFDINLRLCFGRSDPLKLPGQVDFEIEAWEAHHACDLEGRWLGQGLNLFPRKTKGLNLADDAIHEARFLK